MEKVNIKFHDNGTVTYQHKKILQFVPEMSVDKDQKLTVPNIPLLVCIIVNWFLRNLQWPLGLKTMYTAKFALIATIMFARDMQLERV